MSSYDQNLLGEAPIATRAQLQEGYNVDLLDQPPRRTPSARSPPPAPAAVSVPLTVAQNAAENGSGEKINTPQATYPPSTPKPPTSFWRSRNGIITIFVIALIVVGAVVGGAVGGTVTKSSSNNSKVPPPLNSSSSSSVTPTSSQPVAAATSLTQGEVTGPLRTTTTAAAGQSTVA